MEERSSASPSIGTPGIHTCEGGQGVGAHRPPFCMVGASKCVSLSACKS